MATFLAPLTGLIHPTSWKRPAGNRDWRLVQPFGCTGMAWEPPLGDCAHYHRGIDLGNGTCGAPVYAIGDGTVTFAGKMPDGAVVVRIAHSGGYVSGSWHLKDESAALGRVTVVAKGATVHAGALIGHVGSTGNSTACHLHLGITRYGAWRDPWPLIPHL